MSRIGIYTGTFDPIHEGHLVFMSTAYSACKLDRILLIPERSFRHKKGVTDIRHRIGMARLAADNDTTEVVEWKGEYITLADVQALTKGGDELFLLIGTDVALTLKTWTELEQIKRRMHFIIGVRQKEDIKRVHTLMAHLEVSPYRYTCVETDNLMSTSSTVRQTRTSSIPSVQEYIQKHHLYTV
jgi:nicotinate-nucleotide adenylyltransferase